MSWRRVVAPDPLERRIATRIDGIVTELGAEDGQVDDASLAELKRLSELLEIRRKSSSTGRRRLNLAILAVLAIVIVFGLSAVHPRAAIELHVWGPEVAFTTDSAQTILDVFVTDKLTVRGAAQLSILAPGKRLSWSGGGPISIETIGPNSAITLERLGADRSASITLATGRDSNAYAIRFSPARGQLAASLDGSLRIATGIRTSPITLTPSARGVFTRRSNVVALDIYVDPRVGSPILVPIAINDLRLYRADEIHGDSTPVEWHRHSTIDSATVRFVAFNRTRWSLPRDEVLRFEGVRHGRIESITMTGHQIGLRITAEVRNVVYGADRSIQPTWLDALRDRTDLSALAAGVASLVAFVLMLARHWTGRT